MESTRTFPLAALALLALTAGCGGGGGGGSGTVAAPGSSPAPAQLTPIFAATIAGAVAPGEVVMKACIFEARQVGKPGQPGSEFLDELVVETLPEATAPLYDAITGRAVGTTKRAYKGSDGKIGAPPGLWSGVAGRMGNGYGGFGAPCGPGAMTTAPTGVCYWLTDEMFGSAHVAHNYAALSKSVPETGTGGAPLGNPGWPAAVPGFVFWYEAGPGLTCSAPGATTIWRAKG